MKKPANIDEYISGFPKDVQKRLEEMRSTIRAAAPGAEEVISYAMPAYRLNGILVYFAAFKNHIGFYATPTGHEQFKDELSHYKTGKGSVQFPFDGPLPIKLIDRIVKFRVEEDAKKARSKRQ